MFGDLPALRTAVVVRVAHTYVVGGRVGRWVGGWVGVRVVVGMHVRFGAYCLWVLALSLVLALTILKTRNLYVRSLIPGSSGIGSACRFTYLFN